GVDHGILLTRVVEGLLGRGLLLAVATAARAAAGPLLLRRLLAVDLRGPLLGESFVVAGVRLLVDLDLDRGFGRLFELVLLARPRRARRLLGLALGGDRLLGALERMEQLGVRVTVHDPDDAHLDLLADELPRAGDLHIEPL